MTVSGTSVTAGPFTGNGSITSLPFSFKITDESQILVQKTTTSNGATTTLTLDTDYTVSFDESAETGTVTLTTALATGYTITVYRSTAITQTTDFTGQGSFSPASHEARMDLITQMMQERAYDLTRSMKFKVGDTLPSEFLPVLASRASKYLGFDSDGEPTALDGPASTIDSDTYRASYNTGAAAAAATISGITAGFTLVTNHHDSNRVGGSSMAPTFTGTTTAGKAGNWPNTTDGFFYDSAGKQFGNYALIVSPEQWGALGDAATDDSSAWRAMLAFLATAGGGCIRCRSGANYVLSQDSSNGWCLQNTGDNITIMGWGATMTCTDGELQILRSANADNFTVMGLTLVGPGTDGADLGAGLLQVTGGTTIRILHVTTNDSDQDGIVVANATDVQVRDCNADNCSKSAIYVNGCDHAVISGCIVTAWGGHTVSGSVVGAAIEISSNNECTVEGNVCDTGTGYGILCSALSGGARPLNNKIIDNTIIAATNATNISVSGGINCVNGNATKECGTLIDSNLIRACGVYSIYLSGHGGSTIRNNKSIESVRSAIVIDSNNIGTEVSGNTCFNTNTSNTSTQAAIALINAADYVTVKDNNFGQLSIYTTGYGADKVLDSSSGTHNNILKRQRTKGTATIANTTTSIAVTHSLGVTPNAADLLVHPIETLNSASFWWVDTITSTQFTINVNADPGQDVDFAWVGMAD